MSTLKRPSKLRIWIGTGLGISLLAFALRGGGAADSKTPVDPQKEYAVVVQPLVKKYCLECHSTRAKKGSLDLERFASIDHVRKDLKPWQQVVEMLEAGEMPPK